MKKDSTKRAMMKGIGEASPALMKSQNDSPAKPPSPELRAPDLSGIKFALILNGQIIHDPRQLTIHHYDSWGLIAWHSFHKFFSKNQYNPRPPLNWDWPRILHSWITEMYKRNSS